MIPHERYELCPGEWREDPPRVSYGADRSGLVKLIGAEMSASPWTEGESATGPASKSTGARSRAHPPTRTSTGCGATQRPHPTDGAKRRSSTARYDTRCKSGRST